MLSYQQLEKNILIPILMILRALEMVIILLMLLLWLLHTGAENHADIKSSGQHPQLIGTQNEFRMTSNEAYGDSRLSGEWLLYDFYLVLLS